MCAGVEDECRDDLRNPIATLGRIYQVADGIPAHERALLHHGPVAVLVKADSLSSPWGPYPSGSFPILGLDVKCRGPVNHAVLLVGYGQECRGTKRVCTPYWLLRNSWGPQWGDGGYFKVAQQASCGVDAGGSVVPLGSACPGCAERGDAPGGQQREHEVVV